MRYLARAVAVIYDATWRFWSKMMRSKRTSSHELDAGQSTRSDSFLCLISLVYPRLLYPRPADFND